jgi:predicted permease
MTSLSRVRAFVRNLVHRDAVERDLDEEVASYVNLLAAEKSGHGLSPGAARRAALIEAGGVEQVKERVRDVRAGAWIAECGRDIAYAIRMLRRTPGFTLVAVLTLALGVGANSAVFTVVNGVLLRPLTLPDPDRLLVVSYMSPNPPVRSPVTLPVMRDAHYLDFSSQDRVFQHLATYSNNPRVLVGAGDPTHVVAASTTSDFFAVLGVNPVLGRGFASFDTTPGRDHVVVISDALWRARLGGDVQILGRMINLDGVNHQIIGVMPPDFAFPPATELWTPFAVQLNPHLVWSRVVIGRLKGAFTARDARAEIEALAPNFAAAPREQPPPWRADVAPLKELLVANARSSLYVFAGAVAFVLLIACANVANLLLTRATSRRHEMAVRSTLGASRGRLFRQTLTESAVLSLIGGGCGILLSIWGVHALLSLAPSGTVPRLDMIHVDGWVLAFTLAISLLTGLAFGIAPALEASRPDMQPRLNSNARTVAVGRERLREALAVAEIGLALVLVTGAGLLLKSFLKLRAVEPGFRPDHVAALTVDLPGAVYNSRSQQRQFHARLLDELAQLPDVTAVAAVNWKPPGETIQGDYRIEGDPSRPLAGLADKIFVSPGYFRAMGIRILSGRDFTEHDDARAPGAVVISQSLAHRMWPGLDPVGRRLTMADHPTATSWFTVIGVADDIKQRGPGRGIHSAIYQSYLRDGDAFMIDHMTFVVRSTADPSTLFGGIRALLHSIDPNIPGALATMDALVARTTAEPKFQTRLIGIFAGLALLLAAIGIYGVLAYSVAERTKEIGIRIALGARVTDVIALVVKRMLVLTIIGVALGAGAALAVTRELTRFLFEVTPHDPATFSAVAVVVVSAAIVAAVVPASRAKHVDPIRALRTE